MFAFDEINASGGVLGKKIEPVVVDGASNWPLFAEKAKQLLEVDKVAVVFGCWTSVSRKSVLPVFEKNNGMLFYPVQYEGEELSPNIFYTAEAVNQQAIPAVDYLLEDGRKKFYLIGTDYVYPQTTNLVLLEYLLSKGVPIENIGGGLRKDEAGKVISAGQVHALRSHRLPADRRGNQTVRRNGRRLCDQHDQRRFECSVLQGVRRIRTHRGGLPGGFDEPFRGRTQKSSHEGSRRPPRLLGLLHVDRLAGEHEVQDGFRRVAEDRHGPRHRKDEPRDLQPDGAFLRRCLPLEGRGRKGRNLRCRRGAQGSRVRRDHVRTDRTE